MMYTPHSDNFYKVMELYRYILSRIVLKYAYNANGDSKIESKNILMLSLCHKRGWGSWEKGGAFIRAGRLIGHLGYVLVTYVVIEPTSCADLTSMA